MIKKYNKIKEVEQATIGITKKFVEDGIYRETIEKYKEGRKEEEEKEK